MSDSEALRLIRKSTKLIRRTGEACANYKNAKDSGNVVDAQKFKKLVKRLRKWRQSVDKKYQDCTQPVLDAITLSRWATK